MHNNISIRNQISYRTKNAEVELQLACLVKYLTELLDFDVENEDDKKTRPKMQVIQVFKRYWNNKFADVWKEYVF